MKPFNPNQPVCIIGNLNIDLIMRNVPGWPAWGQEVMGSSHSQFSSGQAGYLAFGLRGLNIPTSLVGNVGQDIYGEQILTDLRASGVDTRAVTVMSGQATGITLAIVRPDGERAFISDLGCLNDFTAELIRQSWAVVEPAQIVCLVGLFCTPGLSYSAAANLLSDARAAGKMTMLDTGWDPKNWPAETLAGMRTLLAEVDLFLPNWDEARAITGLDSVEAAAAALQAMGPELVVIKCGEQGSYARIGRETCAVSSLKVEVLDTVGAGDVFNAGFLSALRMGWPIQSCLAFGNATSSLYISRQENRFPAFAEVLNAARNYPFMQDWP